jgi:hypothetical protein
MNHKTLSERMNNIMNRGSEKWLSRSLREEDDHRTKALNDSNSLRDRMANSEAGRAETEGRPQPRSMPAATKPLTPVAPSDNLDKEIKEPPSTEMNDVQDQNEERHGRHLNERQQGIQSLKRQLRDSFDNEDASVEPHIKELRDQISDLLKNRVKSGDGSETAMRNQFITLAALAQSYDGKIRHGEGKRSMFFEDAQQLLNPDVQQMLKEGYGDGSPEQIAKFVKSRKSVDTPMELVEQIYKTLPKKFIQSILTSGGMGNSLDVLGEDGKINGMDIRNEHYAGPDGQRGGTGNKQRQLHLLKLLLDQMGRDGYTGNLLDPRYMELEHVRGLQNVGEDEEGVTLEQLHQREHPDNHLWVGTGVNNEKSDQSMPDFIDGVNERHGGKGKEDYVGINNLDEADKHYVESQDARASLIEDKIEDGMFTEDVDADTIQALFDNELEESKSMNKAGIKKTPVGIADKLRKSLGLVKDRKLKRSQIKTDKELFIPIVMKMANASPEERIQIKEQYNELFHSAADKVAAMREGKEKDPEGIYKKDGKLNESGTWKKLFYTSMKDAGLLSAEDIQKHLQEPDQKRFNKFFEGLILDLDLVM